MKIMTDNKTVVYTFCGISNAVNLFVSSMEGMCATAVPINGFVLLLRKLVLVFGHIMHSYGAISAGRKGK